MRALDYQEIAGTNNILHLCKVMRKHLAVEN